jgi:hypothetical protein
METNTTATSTISCCRSTRRDRKPFEHALPAVVDHIKARTGGHVCRTLGISEAPF